MPCHGKDDRCHQTEHVVRDTIVQGDPSHSEQAWSCRLAARAGPHEVSNSTFGRICGCSVDVRHRGRKALPLVFGRIHESHCHIRRRCCGPPARRAGVARRRPSQSGPLPVMQRGWGGDLHPMRPISESARNSAPQYCRTRQVFSLAGVLDRTSAGRWPQQLAGTVQGRQAKATSGRATDLWVPCSLDNDGCVHTHVPRLAAA